MRIKFALQEQRSTRTRSFESGLSGANVTGSSYSQVPTGKSNLKVVHLEVAWPIKLSLLLWRSMN